MAAITIKNVPDKLYSEIKNRAKRNFRSINNEIIYCLRQAVSRIDVEPDKFIMEIDRLTADLSLPPLTDEFLEQAKNDGRP